MRYFKHNDKEIYSNGIVIQWQEQRMLREKPAVGELNNFHEIPYAEYQRWRIHEVYWDGEIKAK